MILITLISVDKLRKHIKQQNPNEHVCYTIGNSHSYEKNSTNCLYLFYVRNSYIYIYIYIYREIY